VGRPGDLIDRSYFVNGLLVPPDFHGGEENFRSVDYMGIPGPPAETLATMIFDGVLERFERLKFGVIEQGAISVPSWTRQMEAAVEAFARHEERLRALSLRPPEYVERQVPVTPYPTEDVGWIIEQSGPRICMFSSDYPHVEGGRRPIERFEAPCTPLWRTPATPCGPDILPISWVIDSGSRPEPGSSPAQNGLNQGWPFRQKTRMTSPMMSERGTKWGVQ
jgi:hypothetical protein